MYNLVIRALAFTNMPVIKDMAPTFAEITDTLLTNHTYTMEREEQLEKELAENKTVLAETGALLSEKDAEVKRLSEELEKVNSEKREKSLAEEVEKLCLSDDKNVGIKGGEKEKVLAFVKTLSDEQAKAYFELHQGIIVSVDLGEHGESVADGEVNYNEIAEARALKLAEEKKISITAAYAEVLKADPELAGKVY